MEDFYNNSYYKSGWRPVVKEDSTTIVSQKNSADSPKKVINNTEIKPPAEVSNMPDNNDIIKSLSDLNTKIDTLNKCILSQLESTNNLLNLIKMETTPDKKNIREFLKKLVNNQ